MLVLVYCFNFSVLMFLLALNSVLLFQPCIATFDGSVFTPLAASISYYTLGLIKFILFTICIGWNGFRLLVKQPWMDLNFTFHTSAASNTL